MLHISKYQKIYTGNQAAKMSKTKSKKKNYLYTNQQFLPLNKLRLIFPYLRSLQQLKLKSDKLWHYNHDLPLHISGHELSASVWDWSLHPNCWFPDDKFRGDHWNEVVECPQEWFRHRPGGQSLRHGRPSTRSSHTSHQHCKKTTGTWMSCYKYMYQQNLRNSYLLSCNLCS